MLHVELQQAPCNYMVSTWAFKGFLYPYFGVYVCARTLWDIKKLTAQASGGGTLAFHPTETTRPTQNPLYLLPGPRKDLC